MNSYRVLQQYFIWKIVYKFSMKISYDHEQSYKKQLNNLFLDVSFPVMNISCFKVLE